MDAYLREIARDHVGEPAGSTSGIKIDVKAEALDIDPDRAVPFGLLVNELVTNAIKHAFPDGTGRIVLSVEQIGDQIELTVADNGVGMKNKDAAATFREARRPTTWRSSCVSFAARSPCLASEGAGTTVRIRLPLLAANEWAPRA